MINSVIPILKTIPYNYWVFYNFLLNVPINVGTCGIYPSYTIMSNLPNITNFAAQIGSSRSLIKNNIVEAPYTLTASKDYFIAPIDKTALQKVSGYIASWWTSTKKRAAALKFFLYMYYNAVRYPAFSMSVENIAKNVQMNRNDVAEYLDLFISRNFFIISCKADYKAHVTRSYKVNAGLLPKFLREDNKFVWEHAVSSLIGKDN